LLLGLAFVFGLENGLNAPGLASMFFSFTPGLFCLIFFSHYEWALSAGKNFRGIFLMYLARTGLNLLLIVILLLLKTKPEPVLIVWFFNAGIFAGAVTGLFFSGQHYNPVSFGFKTWIEKMFHFGKFVFTSNLLSTVFRNADHFITAALLTSGAVAPLSISTRITNIIDVPSQILADILFPQTAMSNEDNNPGRIRYLFEKAVGGVLAIVLPLFLFIFLLPEQVMTIVAGEQYGSYWFFLRIMILTSLFMPFLKQFGTIMDSTGVPQNSIKIMIIVTAIQVISCFVCIKQFGLMGVAYAAVFTQLCGFIIGQFIAARKYNIRYANAFKYALAFYGDLFRLIKNKTAPLWKKN
jgi:O-antigen/teichoic acid export membrane protein